MKLAVFDQLRLGVVVEEGTGLVDVTDVVPGWSDDPLTAGWWRGLCRDLARLRPLIADKLIGGTVVPMGQVRLHAPVVNPSKVLAAASNYADHVAEMHGVQERTLGGVEPWMMQFDVFLKSTSSISGPLDDIVLPTAEVAAGHEIHHESELVVVIGTGGKDIAPAHALDHILGCTVGLDVTVRSAADRSRRKSYDTFSPLGPWLTTVDEVGDLGDLDIELTCNGEQRQKVNTRSLLTTVPEIVAYASSMMTLQPGDLIFTGAPPGVGPIASGDELCTSISGLGEMRLRVR